MVLVANLRGEQKKKVGLSFYSKKVLGKRPVELVVRHHVIVAVSACVKLLTLITEFMTIPLVVGTAKDLHLFLFSCKERKGKEGGLTFFSSSCPHKLCIWIILQHLIHLFRRTTHGRANLVVIVSSCEKPKKFVKRSAKDQQRTEKEEKEKNKHTS